MIWYRHHADWKVCGIVYVDATSVQPRRLRQLGLEAHTSIIASATRTTLKQTFVSPASWSQPSQHQQPELRYQFPLHDGVSVVAFTCTIGDKDPRVIRGVVREREEARDIYNDAVQQGRTAGLMEQLPEAADVFTTRLGNIPPATRVVVEITYLGELKHDAQSDGLRLTIPMAIAPRYGSYPGDLDTAAAQGSLSSSGSEGGLKITVDAQLPASSQIQSIQSPSHQIAVSIGKTSTSPSTQALSFSQGSATLALANTTSLEKDFILNLTATNLSSPQAILERHPTIPNQHALMTTLVPKFTLPAPKTPPEFVFVCDRSGSMHDKIINLISALRIFIKSLPRGALFNICSFGSRFQFLWPAGSQPYTRDTVAQAMAHVESFSANFGGTEMYQPLEATFKLRRAGSSLEVFLLTDGEIWDQQNLIRMVQEQVSQSAGAIRVFSLGIGDGASSSLVEGVARAGNGFAQTVVDGEDMSGKVVRMVKGAMFQHVEDYQLEVKYGADTTVTISANTEAGDGDGDDDFEIVEKVVDALVIGDGDDAAPPYSEKSATRSTEDKKPAKVSLFDVSVEISADIPTNNIPSAKDRFAHLPACPPPNILQTPIKIPQLFPFNRTTVYLLLNTPFPTGKETGSALAPKSVVLRATAPDGTPLELKIPVTVLPEAGETIHQLAAKKAVQELEEGKGWIYHAKRDEKFDTSKNTKDAGKKTALKDQYPEHIFNDMAKREAVRLGVTFQVGSGKWCSFIAVGDDDGDDSNNENAANTSSPQPDLEIAPKPAMASVGPCRSSAPPARFASSRARCNIAPPGSSAASSFGNSSADFCVMPTSNSSLPPLPPPPAPAPAATLGRRKGSRGMLGVSMAQADESASAYESAPAAPAPPGASAQLYGGGPFASTSINYAEQKKTGGSWLAKMLPRSHKSSHVSTASASTAAEAGNYAPRSYTGMGLSMKKLSKRVSSSSHSERAEWGDEDEDEESHTAEATLPTDKLDALVLLQTFDATWLWADVLKLMGWTEQQVLAAWTETSGAGKSRLAAPGGIGEGLKEPAKDLFATALVVVWLRSKMTGQKDAWELLAEKAIERLGDDDAKVLLKTADEEVDGLLAGAAGVVGRLAEL